MKLKWNVLWVLVLVGGMVGLTGCQKDLLDELEGYGQTAAKANLQLKTLNKVFKKVRKLHELQSLRGHLKAKVLPALKAYTTTLEGLRLQHKELVEAHAILVKAHQGWYRALLHFQQKATNNTMRMRLLPALQKQAQEYDAALTKYKRYMKLVYAAARRRL